MATADSDDIEEEGQEDKDGKKPNKKAQVPLTASQRSDKEIKKIIALLAKRLNDPKTYKNLDKMLNTVR